MPQHVIVVPYDRTWPERAAQEAASLRRALGENCLAVHHIGSTAVEGLAAKPILDFLPVVRSLAGADACRGALEALGYEYLGEFGIPGRRYLRKGGDERTHQVHIFAADDRENIVRHLAVRDYLRPDIGEILIDDSHVYEQIKQQIELVRPEFSTRVHMYGGDIPLFTKFQIESQLLQHQMGKDADISIYVTKDDLRKELAKLKVEGGLSSRSANELEDSATVNMVLQGGIADEKKLNKAFKILKRRKKNLENNYSQEAQQIDVELAKLMK